MADFRSRAPRQRKHWHNLGPSGVVTFAANASGILASFEDADRDPFTVMRILGELSVAPESAGVVAGDQALMTTAIGVVSADAVAIGDTAMPDPSDEADYPWLWWAATFIDFASVDDLGGAVRYVPVESKAMRKIGPGQALVAVSQYTDRTGTPPLALMFSARFLIGTS